MKNPLITTILACGFVSSALAQGTITFVSPIGGIKYSVDGITKIPFPAGNPAILIADGENWGQLNIAAYYAPAGTTISLAGGIPDLTSWRLMSPIIHQIAPLPGGVPGTLLTTSTDVAAGANIQIEIVAWTGTAPTFNGSTLTSGSLQAWSGHPGSGGALGWTQTVGGLAPAPPAALLTGDNAYNGLVLWYIPEPSSLALASLGAGALLIFRRRR